MQTNEGRAALANASAFDKATADAIIGQLSQAIPVLMQGRALGIRVTATQSAIDGLLQSSHPDTAQVVANLQKISQLQEFQAMEVGEEARDMRFALAPSYGVGMIGAFTHGPLLTLDGRVPAQWLALDGLVFHVGAGLPPKLALEAMLPVADFMGEAMFRQLQSLSESMDLAAAKGEDEGADFNTLRRGVDALMEASPWMLHPDHGVVRKSDHLESPAP